MGTVCGYQLSRRVYNMSSNIELLLIRGLPGSGKTTWAKSFTDHHHLETDMYFEHDGKYEFDPTMLKDAHAWCLRHSLNMLSSGRSVVVSNTFTQKWEMANYIEGARLLGIPVRILEAKGTFQNTHGVPESTIEKMRARWESLDD
jgi:predicted kinase